MQIILLLSLVIATIEKTHDIKYIDVPFRVEPLKKVSLLDVCLTRYSEQCLSVLLTTTSYKPFILDKNTFNVGYFYTHDPVHDINVGFKHGTFTLHGYLIRETLTVKNSEIDMDDFLFYLANKGKLPIETYTYEGIFGIGTSKEMVCSSFIEMIFTNYKFPRVFSIQLKGKRTEGKLIFGEEIKERIGDIKHRKMCKLDKDSPVFSCEVHSIYIEHTGKNEATLISKAPSQILINPGFYGIRITKPVFEYLTEKVFKKDLSNGGCLLQKNKEENTFIKCTGKASYAYISYHLRLFIGKFNLNLPFEEIIRSNNDSTVDLLLFYHEDFNNFVIGQYYIQHNINEVVYDIENNEVYFMK